MLLYCNVHMYYLRPATLACVRRFRREAALAGAAVRVMGVPVRVNACAAAAKSKAEKAQRIMVPRPLFFLFTATCLIQYGTHALALRAEKCARLVLYCKSGEKRCETCLQEFTIFKILSRCCRTPVIFRIFAFDKSEADGSSCGLPEHLPEHHADCGGFNKERQTLNSHTRAHPPAAALTHHFRNVRLVLARRPSGVSE